MMFGLGDTDDVTIGPAPPGGVILLPPLPGQPPWMPPVVLPPGVPQPMPPITIPGNPDAPASKTVTLGFVLLTAYWLSTRNKGR